MDYSKSGRRAGLARELWGYEEGITLFEVVLDAPCHESRLWQPKQTWALGGPRMDNVVSRRSHD